MNKKAKYLWLDLETTGLDPDNCRVLECCALATDSDLDRCKGDIVDVVLSCPASAKAEADAVVQEMHTVNGLWDACATSKMSPDQLDAALVALIESTEWEDKPFLAGATVHFDRSFLRRWCPRAEAMLSHRHLDVSSLKMMAVDVLGGEFVKGRAHRALADVEESLSQARDIYDLLGSSVFAPVLTVETPADLGELLDDDPIPANAPIEPAITVAVGDEA